MKDEKLYIEYNESQWKRGVIIAEQDIYETWLEKELVKARMPKIKKLQDAINWVKSELAFEKTPKLGKFHTSDSILKERL